MNKSFASFCLTIIGFFAMAHPKSQGNRTSVSVAEKSYRACAADPDLARITVDLLVTFTNNSRENLIVSRQAANPVNLGALNHNLSNIDEFLASPPETIPASDNPPLQKFIILSPGEQSRINMQGQFLASRKKLIKGTIQPGKYNFTGILDFWPFDESNYPQLAAKWSKFGKLVNLREKLPAFDLKFELKEPLNPCVDNVDKLSH